MRSPLGIAFLGLLFLPGCFICAVLCPREEARQIATFRDTPELAFETFRTALVWRFPDVVYESLSPNFREKYGVPGKGKFKIGYENYLSDMDDLGRLLMEAEVAGIAYGELDGRRQAVMTLRWQGAEGEFVLVDVPSWEALVAIEGYPPDSLRMNLPGQDFSSVLRVADGSIVLGPLDASEAGVTEPGEVLRLTLTHQWLLEDIQRLDNVEPLLERFEAAGETGPR
jgi:hypothetical protein